MREIQPCDDDYPWICHLALVPKDFPIDSTSVDKVVALFGKDDPTKKIFGILPGGDWPYNVKKISNSGCPPQDDVIHIRYDKQERTVSFKCTTFEYRQVNVPAEDYSIFFFLLYEPQELEIKLTGTW